MTENEWNSFCSFRDDFKKKIEEWKTVAPEIARLSKDASLKDTPAYPLENPLVYNTALDEIQKDDCIRLIVIGDNPGKNEQLSKNQKYLVGQSGKLAEGFFKKNGELGVDFRKNVIILNKTPVHTAKTGHLKYLMKNGSPELCTIIEESQKWMAERTALLHKSLESCSLWLVGYSELKKNGIFKVYRDGLFASYGEGNGGAYDRLFVYQHFSMNSFTRDIKKFMEAHSALSLEQALKELGRAHRDEIFGV